MKRISGLALAVAALGACGGGGSAEGSVGGAELAVADAVFWTARSDDGKVLGAMVLLTDVAGACDLLKENKLAKDATGLLIELNHYKDGIQPPVAGTYPVATPGSTGELYVNANYSKSDGACQDTLGPKGFARSGSVTLDSIAFTEGSTAEGTFDLTFGDQGDKVTGSFDAVYCEVPKRTGAPACQ